MTLQSGDSHNTPQLAPARKLWALASAGQWLLVMFRPQLRVKSPLVRLVTGRYHSQAPPPDAQTGFQSAGGLALPLENSRSAGKLQPTRSCCRSPWFLDKRLAVHTASHVFFHTPPGPLLLVRPCLQPLHGLASAGSSGNARSGRAARAPHGRVLSDQELIGRTGPGPLVWAPAMA